MLDYMTLRNKTKIFSDFLQEDIYNLLDTTFQIPSNGFDYKVLEVSEEYIARPDLIAYDAYGDTMYADIICKINGISNPFELNKGMRLVLPTPDNIYNFTILSELVETEQQEYETPVPKTKNEKRKANESLTTDTRFKIDAKSGIIVY